MPVHTITVEKSRLLETLRKNRETHAQKVRLAQENYHKAVVEELERRLAQAKEGKPIDPGFLSCYPIPQDYTREYDRAIDQYDWELAPQIELDRNDFNRFVRDEWEWNDRFAATSLSYIGGS